MKEMIITLVILFGFYVGVHIYMKISNRKKSKEDEGKVKFNAEFFSLTFFPTAMLILVVADEFYKFLILYGYFMVIVFIADKLHKKHLNKEVKN